MNPENTNTQPDSEKISGRMQRDIEKLSPCYAIHRKRHLQSTYGEESKWVTTDKRIKIMGKIGIFAMVCEEQGMPHVVEISEIIPLGQQSMSTHTDAMSENAEIETGSNANPKAQGDPSGESVLGAAPCSLCEGMGELDGFGGGGRTDCHKCDGTGKANSQRFHGKAVDIRES